MLNNDFDRVLKKSDLAYFENLLLLPGGTAKNKENRPRISDIQAQLPNAIVVNTVHKCYFRNQPFRGPIFQSFPRYNKS
jgi:hypothetical protein